MIVSEQIKYLQRLRRIGEEHCPLPRPFEVEEVIEAARALGLWVDYAADYSRVRLRNYDVPFLPDGATIPTVFDHLAARKLPFEPEVYAEAVLTEAGLELLARPVVLVDTWLLRYETEVAGFISQSNRLERLGELGQEVRQDIDQLLIAQWGSFDHTVVLPKDLRQIWPDKYWGLTEESVEVIQKSGVSWRW